jgi:hypothetical protein
MFTPTPAGITKSGISAAEDTIPGKTAPASSSQPVRILIIRLLSMVIMGNARALSHADRLVSTAKGRMI